MLNSNDIPDIISNINKTGFVLEYEISELLQEHHWNVINNRYYVDDITDVVREFDIVAYKVTKKLDVLFYTTLLISCKKNEDNYWGFLTKDLKQNDPNLDYFPVWNWTNNKYIKFQLDKTNWRKRIIFELNKNNSLANIYKMDKHVFAFQEINKKILGYKMINQSMSH